MICKLLSFLHISGFIFYVHCRMLSQTGFDVIPKHAWLTDGDSLMCGIVMMGRQIAKMFSTFSL